MFWCLDSYSPHSTSFLGCTPVLFQCLGPRLSHAPVAENTVHGCPYILSDSSFWVVIHSHWSLLWLESLQNTHTWDRVKILRVKRFSNMGQSVMIRCWVQSHKHIGKSWFMCNGPLHLFHFFHPQLWSPHLSSSVCIVPLTIILQFPTPQTFKFAALLITNSDFACSFLIAHQLAWGFGLVSVMVVYVSVCFVCCFPLLTIFCFCIEKVLDQVTLEKQTFSPYISAYRSSIHLQILELKWSGYITQNLIYLLVRENR